MKASRRDLLGLTAAFALAGALPISIRAATVIRKAIPVSGETLCAIGIGTARRYQGASSDADFARLRASIATFLEMGGSVVDTAPSYGNAESVVGGLLSGLPGAAGLFVAGQIRHVGATTSSDRRYGAFEAMMKRETLDFVQMDYALDNRGAGERLLPLARDRNMAVMINLPFGRGRLFDATRGKPLPRWAADFDCKSWAQFFLKYIISHEAVTCAIPGMAKPEYVVDNMGAAQGSLPDAATRKRMESFIDAL